jgi:O-antigen ligase
MAASGAVWPGQPTAQPAKTCRTALRYRMIVAALLFVGLLIAGGASRADEPRQIVVRLVSIAAIIATLWPLQKTPVQLARGWRWAGLLAYLLVLMQLVPLPPGWWAALPGHAVYADISVASGATSWRPLSLTPDLTLNTLFALLPATAVAAACLYLDAKARARLWLWIVGGALLSGCLGLLQLGAGGSALRFYRETSADSAVGIFANRNHQATFLACALPLLGAILGLRLREHGRRRALAIGAAAAALLVVGDLATASRAGLVLSLAGAAGGLWAFDGSGVRIMAVRGRYRVLALVAGGSALLFAAAATSRLGVLERLNHTDPAAESRLQMLRPLFHTAAAFFPFGSGFGSFETVYRQFEPDALLSTIYMNEAHNEPLQLAIEGGLPALLLLTLFLCWWVATAAHILRGRLPTSRRPLARAAITASALLMAESLVDYPLRTPLLAALFVVACLEMSRAAAYERRALPNGAR